MKLSKKIRFIILLFISTLKVIAQQQGAIDYSFNPADLGFGFGDGANGTIIASVVQPDGKILIVGDFTSYNGTGCNRIARLNSDGTLDITFNLGGSGANNIIRAIALIPDGRIYIGGDFTVYNGTGRNRIARLNSNGSVDGTFGPGTGADNTIRAIAVQSDGKIYIGGSFLNYNGTARKRLARVNTNGVLDNVFNPDHASPLSNPGIGPNNIVRVLSMQGANLLVGGDFTGYSGSTKNSLVRIITSTSRNDSTFNPGNTGPNGSVNVIKFSGSNILIGGDFTTYNGTTRNRIAQLTSAGALDAGFNPSGANNSVLSIAVNSGVIYVGGDFTTFNGSSKNRIVRLNSLGTIEPNFNTGSGADNSVRSIEVTGSGIVMLGRFVLYNGTGRGGAARLNSTTGVLDISFNSGTGANSTVWCNAIQPDGKILIGGDFTLYNGSLRHRISRLTTSGSLDVTFNPGSGPDKLVRTVSIQPSDEKIIIGGDFSTFNGVSCNSITRLNTNGTRDISFSGTGTNGIVYTSAVQPDGKIIIAGNFTTYNGTAFRNVARINSDGSADLTFNPGAGANQPVYVLSLQPDGKILIGGEFTSYDGTARNHIARINANGSLDASFNPGTGPNDWVRAIVLQQDGRILFGGDFTAVNGTPRNRIARVETNGAVDNTFNPGTGANERVFALLVQDDGKVVLGGRFTAYGGNQRNHLARVNGNGSLDLNFDPGTGPNQEILTINKQPAGKILIGGMFVSYNGNGRNRIARVWGIPNPLIWDGLGWNHPPDLNTETIDVDVFFGDPAPVTSNGIVNNIFIYPGGALNVFSGVTLKIKGDLTNYGSENFGMGNVVFNGSAAQSISGDADFWNLELDNSSGLSSTNILNVKNILKLTSGVFTPNELNLVASSVNQYGQISPEGSGSILGDVSMEMQIEGTPGWRHISSPFSGVTLQQIDEKIPLFFSGPNANIFKWSESAPGLTSLSKWIPASGLNEVMNSNGMGYVLRVGQLGGSSVEPIKLRLKGTYSKSTFTIPGLSCTPFSGEKPHLTKGWHLVANPFPSHLNWNSIGDSTRPANLTQEFASWRSSVGQYGYYELGVGGVNEVDSLVPPMHSFWVRCVGQTTSGLLIENADRSVVFVKNHLGKTNSNLNNDVSNLVRLKATSERNGKSDETIVYFGNQNLLEEKGVFKFDVADINSVSLFTKGSVNYAIRKFNTLEREAMIPLFFETGVSGDFKIELSHFQLEEGVVVSIIDNVTKFKHNLKNGGYPFYYNVSQNGTARFTLVFERPEVTSVSNSALNSRESINIYASGMKVFIDLEKADPGIATVEIIDMTGRLVYSKIIGSHENRFQEIILQSARQGYYLVRVNGASFSRAIKVFVAEN